MDSFWIIFLLFCTSMIRCQLSCTNMTSCSTCTNFENIDCYWCGSDQNCYPTKTPLGVGGNDNNCEYPQIFDETCTDEDLASCQYLSTCKTCVNNLNCMWIEKGVVSRNGKNDIQIKSPNGLCWKTRFFTYIPTPKTVHKGSVSYKIEPTLGHSYCTQCALPDIAHIVIFVIALLLIVGVVLCCGSCCAMFCFTGLASCGVCLYRTLGKKTDEDQTLNPYSFDFKGESEKMDEKGGERGSSGIYSINTNGRSRKDQVLLEDEFNKDGYQSLI